MCAELAGPDNPYTQGGPSFVARDVELFVFDVMHFGRHGFLPQEEKRALCERFGLVTPLFFGRLPIGCVLGLPR